MSLADGLGKSHNVPSAPSRLSRLPLILGLPVGPTHVQNFRALGEFVDGFYPKLLGLLWGPRSAEIQLRLREVDKREKL